MNILVISLEFPPSPGGMGEYGFQTARQLSLLNHNIIAVVAYENIEVSEFNEFASKQIFSIKWLKNYNGRTSYLLRKILYFRGICLNNNIELIIVVSPNGGIIGSILKKFYNIPYFIVGHGSEFLPLNFLRNYLIKLYYSYSDYILANSNFTKSIIENSKIKNKNIKVIFPGADDTLFNIEKTPITRDKSKNILLTVGSLSVRKGHRYVLEAINKLIIKKKNIEYWIIGKGPEKENIKKFIKRNNLEKNVKLFGFIKREELPKYYAKANLFILSSTKLDSSQVEGFGIVLIEANLMQLPVIGVKGTGMEDAIEDGKTGILIDEVSSDKIEEVLELFFKKSSVLEEFGYNGYKRAKDKFTWRVFGEKLNNLINKKF